MYPSRSVDGGFDRVPLPVTAGGLWLCGKRAVAPDPGAALRRAGARAIVCFNEASDLEREYPDYLEWLAANEHDRAHWFPIPDLHAPTHDEAEAMVAVMVGRLRAGDGLILHCAGGLGRAPTMAVCVLLALGMPLADALSHVRAHRPMGGPEAGAQHQLVQEFAAGCPITP